MRSGRKWGASPPLRRGPYPTACPGGLAAHAAGQASEQLASKRWRQLHRLLTRPRACRGTRHVSVASVGYVLGASSLEDHHEADSKW